MGLSEGEEEKDKEEERRRGWGVRAKFYTLN